MLGAPKSWIVNYVVRHRRKQVPAWRIEGAIDFRTALSESKGSKPDPVELGHQDLAFLQYTGGTTGVAKGARLTHGNIVANSLQARAWVGPSFADASPILITPVPL